MCTSLFRIQVALDETLVPHARRLRIGKSNFRLKSDISSKKSTLQLVYDVRRLTPFFKAFLVTADVPKIYMHEFWATATVRHHSIRFKMDNKKHIVNLEYFREMLHICLRLLGHTFNELPFEKEILAFLLFLRHSGEIRKLTDININKLHQPWRSCAAIIRKLLKREKNVDFAYLLWEDFVYQVEHKDAKKINEMYYPRNSEAYKEYHAVATGATPPKTKASVRKTNSSFDTTVTHPPTASAGTRLSTSAKDKQPAKASKAKSLTALSEVAMTEAEQLKLAIKEACSKHTSPTLLEVMIKMMMMLKMMMMIRMMKIKMMMKDEEDDDDDQEEGNDDDQDSDEEGEEFIHLRLSIHDEEETKDEESFDLIAKRPENTDDEGNCEENLGLNVDREEGQDKGEDEDELYRDFAKVVSSVPGIVQRYMDQQMNEAVKVAVQIQSDRLRDEAQAENKEFLKNLDENIQKIIKEDVMLMMRTKIGGPRDEEKEMSPSQQALQNRKLPGALASLHKGLNLDKHLQHPEWFSQQKKPPTLDRDWNKTLPATHGSIQPWISELAKQTDSRSFFNELMDTPVDFLAFLINQLKVDTLTMELLAGPTYELMKGSCKRHQYPHNLLKPLPLILNSRGRRVIPFDQFINNDLEYLRGGASTHKYTTSVTKKKAAYYGHIMWIEDLVSRTMWIQELVGYDKHYVTPPNLVGSGILNI
nr:hypothetical protein [Tanacetum cinerariifolium]